MAIWSKLIIKPFHLLVFRM